MLHTKQLLRSAVLGLSLAAGSAASAQHQFWTAPTGPGGTWNLYEVVTTAATWTNADTAAKAKAASATNLASMAGNTTTGHLIQVGSSYENDFSCAAGVLTPGSGNSNFWLGLNDVATEMGNVKTGWQWSGTTGPEILDDGEFSAWAPNQPDNAGSNEDAVEMRTDGMWNDNVAGTPTRRYVIEWEINSATAIPDARQYQVYYTAPFGPGGTWNLYKAVFQGDNYANAHNIAINATADSTGVSGVAGNSATGHLVSVGSQMENDFVYQITAYSSRGSVNTWLGSDHPDYGGTEAGFSKTTGWVWPGTTDPWVYEKFSSRPRIAAAINSLTSSGEPNNGGQGENFVEMTSNSFWNDIAAPSTTFRRYVIEWDIASATPIAGAATGTLPIIDNAALPATGGVPAVGSWNIRRISGTGITATDIAWMTQHTQIQPAAATKTDITSPVLNHNDINTNNFTGRGNGGLFFWDLPIPGDNSATVADDNTYVTAANTKLDLSGPGPWTLNIHSDDGFAVRVIGSKVTQVGGGGVADFSYGDGAYFPLGGGDTNTRVTFTVPAAGQYDVHFIHYDGTGGSYYEMSMAPGAWLNDWDTQWTLVGGTYTGTPILPDKTALGLTPATANPGWWNVTTYPVVFPANNPITFNSYLEKLTADYVAAVSGAASPLGSGEVPVMNLADLNNANREMLAGDYDFPATTADDNNFATAALGTFRFEAGTYTFNIRCDDLCAIRFGSGAQVLGRVSILANGAIDPFDPSTFVWWQANGDINCKMVVRFPTTGDYEFTLFHGEGTGGAAAEVSWLAGVQTEDFSGNWIPLGASIPLTPVLPPTLPGIPTDQGMWSIHTVHSSGETITSLSQAAALLNDPLKGIHSDGQSPVVNFVDDGAQGTGGFFAGDRNLPGDKLAQDDNDFAMVAKSILYTPTAGIYTIVVKHSDGCAIRLPGNRFLALTKGNVANSPTWDPADPGTITSDWNGTAIADDLLTRGLVYLPAGCQPIEVVSFDRSSSWHLELYARPGVFNGTAEYVAGATANNGDASIQGNWRLVGHVAEPVLAIPGMTGQWSVRQSPHSAASPLPVGTTWDTTNAYAWLTTQTTITPVLVNWINYNDPGFGGPGSIPNDLPIPMNTAGTASDDHNYATEMRGALSIPVDGTYCFGWQGDDGGFFEFEGANPPVFTRIVAQAIANGIESNTDGAPGARIKANGGSGNTRTIGQVTLAAGDYPIRCFWKEGTGGSYFEIFASPAGGDATMVSLLKTGGASATTADEAGIRVLGTKIKLADATLTPTQNFSFSFDSVPGVTYTIQRTTGSADGINGWQDVGTVTAADVTTTWTTPAPVNPATDPRYFYRATGPLTAIKP